MIIYDLQPFWIYQLDDGTLMRLDDLEARARREPKLSGHAMWGNAPPRRMLVNISADGLSLWDVKTRDAHRWADRSPKEGLPLLDALLKVMIPAPRRRRFDD